jgi:hypothetical protein
MSTATHEGGCLCGGIRYRITAPIHNVMHCHCRMCQRASGAVAISWFTVSPEHMTLSRGTLKTWRSSETHERGFCPNCGCQITFRNVSATDRIGITAATLDDAANVPAQYHVWTSSRLPWLHLDPYLPEWPRDRAPDAP